MQNWIDNEMKIIIKATCTYRKVALSHVVSCSSMQCCQCETHEEIRSCVQRAPYCEGSTDGS